MEDAERMKLITKLAAAAAGPALAAPLVQVTHGATATARPATVYYDVVSPVSVLGCRGELDANDNAGATRWYARAFFSDDGDTCDVWLERSTNGGKSWYTISAVHQINPGQQVTTYWYWDGAGYLARACIDPNEQMPATCSASF
jgi:hypothetical protein